MLPVCQVKYLRHIRDVKTPLHWIASVSNRIVLCFKNKVKKKKERKLFKKDWNFQEDYNIDLSFKSYWQNFKPKKWGKSF